MVGFEIEKRELEGRVLAVYSGRDLYAGVLRKLVNLGTNEVLCEHEKSIRCIAGNGEYVGCCSYDGTATIFASGTDRYVERIEGPDTEMKGLAFSGNLIAIATRGRTVWILEDLEISKILDDHTQDVKGCCWHGGRLYSWSYDNTVNVYEMFEIEHSWEMVQSIDLGSIVWSVVFRAGAMYATLQDGHVVSFEMHGSLWERTRSVLASAYPITSCCVAGEYLAVVCNRNCLVLLDGDLGIAGEALLCRDETCDARRSDILCCSFWEERRTVVCGSEDGMLYLVRLC